mmetsp:Transcript_36202/g.85431  ORF Transcript_36202/g.85431 Transcript_36202/m.85431 type:complete len:231 (-) Transcript_36202:1298-1990(-)
MPIPIPPTLLYKSKSVALVASLMPEPESSTAKLAESPPPAAGSTAQRTQTKPCVVKRAAFCIRLSRTCMSMISSIITCILASGTSTRNSTPGCICGRTTAAAERISLVSSVGASASLRLPVSAPCSVASVPRYCTAMSVATIDWSISSSRAPRAPPPPSLSLPPPMTSPPRMPATSCLAKRRWPTVPFSGLRTSWKVIAIISSRSKPRAFSTCSTRSVILAFFLCARCSS